MIDVWMWFTRMENSKPLALVIFFSFFCGVLIYVFFGKRRSERLESYKYIPFLDDPQPPSASTSHAPLQTSQTDDGQKK